MKCRSGKKAPRLELRVGALVFSFGVNHSRVACLAMREYVTHRAIAVQRAAGALTGSQIEDETVDTNRYGRGTRVFDIEGMIGIACEADGTAIQTRNRRIADQRDTAATFTGIGILVQTADRSRPIGYDYHRAGRCPIRSGGFIGWDRRRCSCDGFFFCTRCKKCGSRKSDKQEKNVFH